MKISLAVLAAALLIPAGAIIHPETADKRIDSSEVGRPMTCQFSPSGTVNIEAGHKQVFSGSGCSGTVTQTITPAGTDDAGFNAACTDLLNESATGFLVFGCNQGGVTVTVRQNRVVVQGITVNIIL